MKKAYNVYEKAYIPAFLRNISLALVFGVCFLGYQTQSTAQVSDADLVQVDKSDIKAIHNDYDLSSVDAEDAKTTLKEYGTTILAVQQSTDEGELEQVVSMNFMLAIIEGLDAGVSVQAAVEKAYVNTLSSRVVVVNKTLFNAQRTLERVIEVLD